MQNMQTTLYLNQDYIQGRHRQLKYFHKLRKTIRTIKNADWSKKKKIFEADVYALNILSSFMLSN